MPRFFHKWNYQSILESQNKASVWYPLQNRYSPHTPD